MKKEEPLGRDPAKASNDQADDQLKKAIQTESALFEEFYRWLEAHMSSSFFKEFTPSQLMTIAHNLVGFNLQGNFIQIHFENCSIVLCLDSADADLRILKHYAYFGIKNYQTFISAEPLPSSSEKLRIAIVHFTDLKEPEELASLALSKEQKALLFKELHERNSELTLIAFDNLLKRLTMRLIRTLPEGKLLALLDLFFRAGSRDYIQYDVDYDESGEPSMKLILAWKNTQKYNFLYRLTKLIYRHNLTLKGMNAAYIDPYSAENMLLMSISLHGQNNLSASKATDIQDFLQELAVLKYFEDTDLIESVFVTPKILRGNLAHLLRSLRDMIYQLLLHEDANIYSLNNIEEGLCKHPDLIIHLMCAFEAKFHPEKRNLEHYQEEKKQFEILVDKLDTGNLLLDNRHKNILRAALNLIEHTLKTNFYRNNKSTFAFRFDPRLMEKLPYDYTQKFPEIPYAIFFIKGQSFIGFHIRFKDLSRGGLRTIFPQKAEQALWERLNIFSECYNLAYTQQKKNKDIPEGGSKAVIFIEPFEPLRLEMQIYQKELRISGLTQEEIDQRLRNYQQEERLVYLYQSQRAYIYSLLTLVNCEEDGSLRARDLVDYLNKPEYIYLGPDENMHNSMIEWIAEYSKHINYKPGSAFISSKPLYGINHKEFGVTSLGVNVYMHKVLEFMGIDPLTTPFTIKISGGPDGDVAGNQIYNLYRFYSKTAKLLALTDGSGTMYDPHGIDLEELVQLFRVGKALRYFNPEKLSEGGFLLDNLTKRELSSYSQETLCYRKKQGKIIEDWLIGSDSHHLYSHNLHQVITDIFIPAGGRPRTLSSSNWQDFLDPTGQPTSKAIVEGANLYLTTEARHSLEQKGVIVIKDSSANKGGVICSSLEVLCGLILTDEEFLKEKPALMPEILEFIKEKAAFEAELLLRTYSDTKSSPTDISDWISKRINTYTYQILDYLTPLTLSNELTDPFIRCLIAYVPHLFRTKYSDRVITAIPDIHKKAIISCYIASRIVYQRGLAWSPSIVDILPLIIQEL